jgi:hypothetical protein
MRETPGRVGSVLLLMLFLTSALRAADEAKVEIKEVKYASLADTIKKNKGKIIVVDVWALW